MKYKDMERGIRESLILEIVGDIVQDESGRELARVRQNKVVLGTKEHELRLVIIQPKIKDIKNREQKKMAMEAVKKARIKVEFLDPYCNDLPIFSQVLSEEICNQSGVKRGVKRKNNSQHEGGTEPFVADRLESATATNPAELQSLTTHTSHQGFPVEAASPVLYKGVTMQSEVDEHAIPAGKLFWLSFLLPYTLLFQTS